MLQINEKLLEIPFEYTKKITEAIKSDKTVINLARGDSEFITPSPITDYLKKIIDEPGDTLSDVNIPVGKWTHYEKESGSIHLKEAICKKYLVEHSLKIDKKNILITHGGMNAIYCALKAILVAGDEVVIFDPAYIAYYPICHYLSDGITVHRVHLCEDNNYEIDYTELKKFVTSRTKAIILTSPYNPCGKVYSYESIKELYTFCKGNHIFLIHDENHEKEIYDGRKHYPAMIFDRDKDTTILLNSMSRLGMGGWRVGWMIADERIIRAANAVNAYVNMTCNTFVQECAAYALEHYFEMNYDNIFESYARKRDKLYALLNSINGITCFKPEGTCYLFPNISRFYELHKNLMLSEIYNSGWLSNLEDGKKEQERQYIHKYKSYAVYLFILIKYRVGVLPGCCYGPQSDDYLRFSFSVKAEAVEDAMKRLKPLTELR